MFAIHLPPLRERGEDLALLVQFFLRRFSRELGREVREVAPEALERLRGYSWPGNVRELQSVLKQALLRSPRPGPAAGVPPRTPRGARRAGGFPGGGFDPEAFLRQRLGPDSRDLYAETHRELDRLVLPRVLEYTGGNQARAALLLGIARRTLRTKLRDLGLQVTRTPSKPTRPTRCRPAGCCPAPTYTDYLLKPLDLEKRTACSARHGRSPA